MNPSTMQEFVASVKFGVDSRTPQARLDSLATNTSSGEDVQSTVSSEQDRLRASSTPLSSVPSDFEDYHSDVFGLLAQGANDASSHLPDADAQYTLPKSLAMPSIQALDIASTNTAFEMEHWQSHRSARIRTAPRRFGQVQPDTSTLPAALSTSRSNAIAGQKRRRAMESTISEFVPASEVKRIKLTITRPKQTTQSKRRPRKATSESLEPATSTRIVTLKLGSKFANAEETTSAPTSSPSCASEADAVSSLTEEYPHSKQSAAKHQAPRKRPVKTETAKTPKKDTTMDRSLETPRIVTASALRIDSVQKGPAQTFGLEELYGKEQPDTIQKQPTRGAATETFPVPYLATPVDGHLVALSQRLMTKLPISEKPSPVAQPVIWADGKQALCETLSYYQAYQGAAYVSGGIFYSANLDGNGHGRDFMDSDAIITRGGGGMDKDDETGEMMVVSDHKENSHSRSIRNNIASEIPVVILCGSQNTNAPTKMPHRYSVLDWFKPTDVWFEKTKVTKSRGKGHYVFNTMKYRFEKLVAEKASWWAPIAVEPVVGLGELEPPHIETCASCGTTHKQIYLEGWMCLFPDCNKHFALLDGTPGENVNLNMDPRFLKQKTIWASEAEPCDLRPELPDPSSVLGANVSSVHAKGMCCPKCGKCTQRIEMRGWICSNESCGFEHVIPPNPIPADNLRDWARRVGSGPTVPLNTFLHGPVTVTPKQLLNYRALVYKIRGVEGEVWHLIANDVVLKEPRGPNEMFETLQKEEIGLKRPRMGSGKKDFINSFAANFGEDYKFSASVQSTTFDNAPWVIKDVRTRLNWAARQALGDEFTKEDEFNELLVLQYLQGQKINYHDDGEEGLGPTVTSLSLGAPARMGFRIKGKHWSGCGKSNDGGDSRFTTQKPLEGTIKYKERLAAWTRLQAMEFPSAKEKAAHLKQLSKDLGLKNNNAGNTPLMSLYLRHGDIMIMHGEAIQQYVEHEVEPEGTFRYALTCRQILKTHYSDKHKRPDYEVAPDDGHYDGSAISQPWERIGDSHALL